MTKWLNRSITV